MTTLIQHKHPETGQATGATSFGRVFGIITGATGNALILAAIYSTLFQAEVRIPLETGIKWGGALVVFAALLYTGSVVRLAVDVIRARYAK